MGHGLSFELGDHIQPGELGPVDENAELGAMRGGPRSQPLLDKKDSSASGA